MRGDISSCERTWGRKDEFFLRPVGSMYPFHYSIWTSLFSVYLVPVLLLPSASYFKSLNYLSIRIVPIEINKMQKKKCTVLKFNSIFDTKTFFPTWWLLILMLSIARKDLLQGRFANEVFLLLKRERVEFAVCLVEPFFSIHHPSPLEVTKTIAKINNYHHRIIRETIEIIKNQFQKQAVWYCIVLFISKVKKIVAGDWMIVTLTRSRTEIENIQIISDRRSLI